MRLFSRADLRCQPEAITVLDGAEIANGAHDPFFVVPTNVGFQCFLALQIQRRSHITRPRSNIMQKS